MTQFLENAWTEGWKEWQTYFMGPFWLLLGVQKPTDMKTYRWTQIQRKKIKKQHYILSMLVPQIEYLYYLLNVEGVTQKGSLLTAEIT